MQQINFGNIDDDCVGPTIGDVEECRYARWLIGRYSADAFDAIEIGGMMFVNDGIVKPCADPDDVPAFYSVYLYYANRPGRSPDCVGDFATAERAWAYAAQIHDAFGWPIAIDRRARDEVVARAFGFGRRVEVVAHALRAITPHREAHGHESRNRTHARRSEALPRACRMQSPDRTRGGRARRPARRAQGEDPHDGTRSGGAAARRPSKRAPRPSRRTTESSMNEIKHTRDKRAAFEAWAQSYWFYDSQEECHASDAESAAWDAWEERSALIDDLALALEMIAAEDDAAWKRTKRPLLTSGVRAMLDAALIKAGRKEVPKRSPRFENVSCSGCGRDFGPGDSGYSSCDEHAPTKVRHIRICGDGV